MSTTAKVPWYDKIIHSMYGAYSFQVSWVIFGYYLVYFYTDVVGLSATVAGTIMLVAMFAFTVALMIGVFLMKPLIKLFRDTGRAYQICMAASAGFSILLFVLCKQYGPTAAADSMRFGLLFIVFVINAVFSGAYYSFSNVMIPATVDYGEWKNGNGQAGIVSAINGFCITIGAALGAQIMGILLDGSGYVANQTQSDATLNWLLILAFVIPAVVTIIHFVLQMFYGLNDKRLDECMQEVRERRKGEKIMAKKLFTTIYGRNLVGELKNIVQRPYFVVTMEDLWETFKDEFDDDCIVHFVKTLEYDEIMKEVEHRIYKRKRHVYV